MDAFYVSVELRRRPELRGLPVVVAGTGPRAVVTTASYEARRFGVGSAMPAARARRLCPDGVFLRPDFAYYREASREVMAIVRAHVETVEVIGLDEAYMELTGLPAPHASMRRVREEIEAQTGLHSSIGIGPSKLVAKVASDAEKPRGFVVLTREQACERFAASPCGLVPGIGPKTAERLRSIGIDTLGKLAARRRRQARRAVRAADGVRAAPPRALRGRLTGDPGAQGDLRIERDHVRLRRRRPAAARGDPADARRSAVRDADRQADAAGARSASRCASTTSPPTPVRGRWPSRWRSADRVGPVALDLLRRFAAPRPVRLLGVRVAGLVPAASEADEQLKLAV